MAKPSLLLSSPDKTLKPKLEYFCNVGIAGPDLTHIISTNPDILTRSLNNTIIPSVNYLASLVGTDTGFITILIKSWWVLYNAEQVMGSNIAILQEHGVPQCNIAKVLMLCPRSIYQSTDLIKEKVLQLVSMGFCPLSMTFLYGLHVLIGMTKPKWDEKMVVYSSFGWSEDEVLSVFKKQPYAMASSVKKISLALDFLMNSLNWTREDVARNSTVINLSLEKRVIPRCHVLQILLSENLISKTCMGQALREVENVFLMKYVTKFQHEVPDLLNMYQKKMSK